MTAEAGALAPQEETGPKGPRGGIAGLHLPALDGLRGIAILLVMAMHYCGPLYEQGTLFSKVIYKMTHFGWCGVDLFFVLSGFLITGILYDAKGSARYFRDFYVRRTLRIFPLYYGVLAILFVVIPLVRPYEAAADRAVAAHQQSLWLYYTNIETAVQRDWVQNGQWLNMSHFWSLAVEEQFYVVWPLVVLVCNRRRLMAVCLGCIVGALGLRLGLTYGAGDVLTPYVIMPCRMDALAWGGLVAAAVRGPGGAGAWVKAARWVLAGALAALAPIAAYYRYLSPGRPVVLTVGFSALAALFAAVLLLAVVSTERSVLGRICRQRWLRRTGKIAYGLYVFHYLIYPLTLELLPVLKRHLPAALAELGYVACAFAAAYGISALSWHVYEKHFIRLKDVLAPVAARAAV